MTDNLLTFGQRYRRYLKHVNFLTQIAPKCTYPVLKKTLGRWLSPYNQYEKEICSAMSSIFPNTDQQIFWEHWRDSHADFIFDFMNYQHLDEAWLKHAVTIEDPDTWRKLLDSGGLLLTYHTHHQNTLGCILGLSGATISGVAAAPETSPLFPLIGQWAQRLNAWSATHFKGGKYLFTNDLRALSRDVQAALAAGQVLVCLADVDHASDKGIALQLMGRLIAPPTGVIELSMRRNSPVFAAILAPIDGKMILKLRQLNTDQGLRVLLSEYLQFLETTVALYPAVWQGWEWFSNLPSVEKVSE